MLTAIYIYIYSASLVDGKNQKKSKTAAYKTESQLANIRVAFKFDMHSLSHVFNCCRLIINPEKWKKISVILKPLKLDGGRWRQPEPTTTKMIN